MSSSPTMIPSGFEVPVLESIADRVHDEMRMSGQWEALAVAGGNMVNGPEYCRGRSREHAAKAAQMTSIYKALYRDYLAKGSTLETPTDLEESVAKSYVFALEGRERHIKERRAWLKEFSPEFYAELEQKIKGPGIGLKIPSSIEVLRQNRPIHPVSKQTEP